MVPLPKRFGYAAVAELADEQDLKSCGTYTPVPVRFRFAAVIKSERNVEESMFLLFFVFKKCWELVQDVKLNQM